MTKHKKLIFLAVAVLAAMLAVAAGGGMKSLDIVGENSVTAFGEILAALPDGVTTDSAGYSLAAPDGTARFRWGADGVALEFDAGPFVKAGLDTNKLPDAYAVAEKDGKTFIIIGTELPAPAPSGESPAVAAYGHVVDVRRDLVNYHSFLDHYGVKVGGGNMLEWAKDMAQNGYDGTVQDKDIVFSLNPEPLVAAGADPEKINGWLHIEVPVMAGGGTAMEWHLLKPFNLR